MLAEARLATGDGCGALGQAVEANRILGGIFAERPAYGCEQYGKALPVLARAQFAVEGKEVAIATLLRGIEQIAPYFEQRPRALFGVMDGLRRTLVEIDPNVAHLVPASVIEKLDKLAA